MRLAAMQIEWNVLARECAPESASLSDEDPAIVQGEVSWRFPNGEVCLEVEMVEERGDLFCKTLKAP